MSQIVFSWMEGENKVSRSFDVSAATIVSGKLFIGRDPERCDVVLPSLTDRDRTVSRCHAEVTFNSAQFGFYLHNLKRNNPVYINSQMLGSEPQRLTSNSCIRLGDVELTVESVAAVPETIIVPLPGQQPTIVSAPIVEESVSSTPDVSTSDVSTPAVPVNLPPAIPPPSGAVGVNDIGAGSVGEGDNGGESGSVLDRVKDHLFSCPNGHQYTLEEAKELGWICKFDGYLITSTFVAN